MSKPVVSTLPCTAATQRFCDQEFFEHMSPHGVFFNVGRDDTVDEDALYNALKRGKIGGAVLDMVKLLPFSMFNRFRRLHNTLVFPGIVSTTRESQIKAEKRIAENLKQYFETGTSSDAL